MPNIAYLNFYYERIATIDKLYDGALMLTALEDETVFQITFSRNITGSTYHFDISYDYGMTWESLDITNNGTYYLDEVNEGQSIMIAGTNEYALYGLNINTNDDNSFKVSGNIMSLLDPVSYKTITTIPYDNCFNSLFKDSNVVDASELILSATTLDDYCYYFMFKGCTSLVNPPQLPATTLALGCYNSMFSGCTSLNNAPVLPATTLVENCYSFMFERCTSLNVAPQLPATTLATQCYAGMFDGCTGLTVAPMLPATTLATQCYQSMFSGCTSLNTAPELPATTLAPSCYNGMFRSCTSLITAPVLPATTLANHCYSYMFNGCSRLNYIRCLATTYDPELYTVNWVQYVAPTGTFIKDTNTWWDPDDVSGIPIGWTVYNEGEVIVNYYNVTVTLDPGSVGGGTCTGEGTYESGKQATLIAYPSEGYIFVGWEVNGEIVSRNNPYYFDVYSDVDVVAIFAIYAPAVWNVILSQSPDIGATLTGAGTYEDGTEVTVTTTPMDGYTFLGWERNGAIVSTDYSYVFTVSNNIALTATYELYVPPVQTCTVTVNPNIEGAGTCTGGGLYVKNSLVTLTATPSSDYIFAYWSLNGQVFAYEDTISFKVTSDMNIIAVFQVVLGYENEYLTFESVLDGNNSIYIEMPSEYYFSSASIEYSYNNGTWNTITLSQYNNYIRTLKNSDTIRFRNFICNTIHSFAPQFHFGYCNVYGNILSFHHDHIDFNNSTDKYYFGLDDTTLLPGENFSLLFSGCYIIDAHNLKLTATTLTEYCYSSMFKNCTELVLTPTLPATTLAPYCYLSMFEGCISLTNAPVLPATTATNYCYADMFRRCTSLVHPPTLPATTLAEYCYYYMFWGCTSLTNAPALPATTLAHSCYKYMFEQCTSLVNAPALPATTLAYYCYDCMFMQCTSLVNAPALPATTVTVYCYYAMFEGCTSLTTAPELPATTMYEGCYQSMFEGCTSLINAPELPATTLAPLCYKWMFDGCTALHNITCLATNIAFVECTYEWVNDVALSGTFTKAASMSDWTTGRNGIPSGWTVVDAS